MCMVLPFHLWCLGIYIRIHIPISVLLHLPNTVVLATVPHKVQIKIDKIVLPDTVGPIGQCCERLKTFRVVKGTKITLCNGPEVDTVHGDLDGVSCG